MWGEPLNNSYSEYVIRKEKYEKLNIHQKKVIKTIANLRLSTFIAGFPIIVWAGIKEVYGGLMGVFFVWIVSFIYLSIKHSSVIEEHKYTEAFIEINDNFLKRLNEEWKSFKDQGSEFRDYNHNYAQDLDIFGENSIFQWMNCCRTSIGRQTLSRKLRNPIKDIDLIKKVQEAVRELAGALDFRQEFEAEGRRSTETIANLEELYSFANMRNDFYFKPWVATLTRLLPLATIISFVFSILLSEFRYTWTVVLLAIQIGILLFDYKNRNAALQSIFRNKNVIKVYYRMICDFEKKDVKSDYLLKLKKVLIQKDGEGAVEAMDSLFALSDIIADRKNRYYQGVNILFLCEYANMIELEKWRRNFGHHLKEWLEVIGEVEALNSIASIAYDYPEWCMASVIDEERLVRAERIGHPLLGNKKVTNNITIENSKDILLITGSNMSGKSTFLRTIGVNLVLAYIGAPVCAKSFTCSIMDIYTCMRTGDNLEKGISSFYAEILRVKSITEAAELNKNIFFLLDELFKGTNSEDRHMGARALISQLSKGGAMGMVSTHDLELCDLEVENEKIKNYHFEEYYENGEIKFNYEIKEGKSTTRNAIYLVRLAGIQI